MTATARQTYVPPTHFAMIEAALGNRDQAFEHLDSALSVRDARLTLLKIDPKWDPLRSDPRYQTALTRMGY
jgi:adenylate cyclase